jgi:hypothetical protein
MKTLLAIQHHFHTLIRERAAEFTDGTDLELPELTDPLPAAEHEAWLAVPGMYGGFSYWLEGEGEQMKLVTDSWSRVVGGSGQRHVVTAEGSQLVREGSA